jgi:hypothetical protein
MQYVPGLGITISDRMWFCQQCSSLHFHENTNVEVSCNVYYSAKVYENDGCCVPLSCWALCVVWSMFHVHQVWVGDSSPVLLRVAVAQSI